ncbi:MAG: ribonuclease H [Bdellovibrionota bacterium]
MKKKHLTNLKSLEKWLTSQKLMTEGLQSAVSDLRTVLEGVEEIPEAEMPLPLPLEISSEPEMIAIYSDGGCRGNPGPGACAYLAQAHNGEVIAEGVDYESLTTNNKMELQGPLMGLLKLTEILPAKGKDPLLTRVKVLTDSKYVVDGMKSWVPGWKARGWKKADNKAPENLSYWQELDQIRTRFMEVQWEWVKGHAGHPQNEYCDRKANEAMDENSR